MNVVFLTMVRVTDIEARGIYNDLLRKFRDSGHTLYIVTPRERRMGLPTELVNGNGNDNLNLNLNLNLNGDGKVGDVYVLGVKTLNLQKTSTIEKGIGQVLVEGQYKKAIKRYLPDVKFDLILYSTPPITFPKVIAYLKKRNPQAMSYLLLKDIFPQNAVDIGLMPGEGFKFQVSSFRSWVALAKYQLYKYFRKKEKRLYALSDYIGCMSPANVSYVIRHNSEIDLSRVEVAPNSIELSHTDITDSTEKDAVRIKYGLPVDKPVFIYGGNLGKPQGIPYLIECLEANKGRQDCYFVIVGTGTELPRLLEWYNKANTNGTNHTNVRVMKGLPKEDYDMLVRSCDVGLIFLDHRFTIPNYPSRLLSYLENKMPVICATDPNTDMGRIAEENGYGYWCESVKPEDFTALVDKMLAADRKAMGERGYKFLCENYTVENTYNAIMEHFHNI